MVIKRKRASPAKRKVDRYIVTTTVSFKSKPLTKAQADLLRKKTKKISPSARITTKKV